MSGSECEVKALTIIDNIITFVMAVIASLGLILIGMKFLSEAMQNLGSGILSWSLSSLDKNKFVSLITGAVAAFVVQSGVTTATMAISFSTSGILGLDQLMFFLLGSNLGTVFTPWLFALHPYRIEFYLVAFGFLPMLYAKPQWLAQLSRGLFAIGLMLLAYRVMIITGDDTADFMLLSAFVRHQMTDPLWALLVPLAMGGLFAAVVRSSVALLAVTMALVELQGITPRAAGIFVLGVNLGCTLPVLWASYQADINGRRAALGNFLSQLITVLVILPQFDFFFATLGQTLDRWGMDSSARPEWLIPTTHLAFNFIVLAVFTAIYPIIRWAVSQWVKGLKRKEPQRLQFHGPMYNMAPALALELAEHEVKKMSAMVETILQLTHNWLAQMEVDSPDLEKILKYESITDNILNEVGEFLTQVNRLNLTENQSQRVKTLLRIADELESIADRSKSIFHKPIRLTPEVKDSTEALRAQLEQLASENLLFYETFFAAYTAQHKTKVPKLAEDEEQRFNDRALKLKAEHLRLIKELLDKGASEDLALAFHQSFLGLLATRSHTFNLYDQLSH